MLQVALSFRAICGGFVSVFVAFMFRRAMERKSMFIRTLKMCRLQDGAIVGFLLAHLYLGVFLHRCGDVELNPGPGPSGRKDSLRQTQLDAGASSSPGRKTTTEEPTLKDVIASLQDLTSKFEELREEVREIRMMPASSQAFSLVLFNMNSSDKKTNKDETNKDETKKKETEKEETEKEEPAMTEEKRRENMTEILDKIVSELPLPMFILCQDHLNDNKQLHIWRTLGSAGVRAVECTQTAGIVYLDNHPPGQLNVQFVSEGTLQETKQDTMKEDQETVDYINGEIFGVDRLTACTFTLSEKKVLLVSWHGPYKLRKEPPPRQQQATKTAAPTETQNQKKPGKLSDEVKLHCFRRLIRFSEKLRGKTSSRVVLLGGDFNLPLCKAKEEMSKIWVNTVYKPHIKVEGAVEALYDPPPDRLQLLKVIDYLVYWPKDQLPELCARPDYRNRLDIGTRPFDHPVIGYRFGDSVFQSVARWSSDSSSQSAPSSRKIVHIIPFRRIPGMIASSAERPQTCKHVRVCLQWERVEGEEANLLEKNHKKVAYKATCRFLHTETQSQPDISGHEWTAALIIGKKDSRTVKKEIHDFFRQLDLLTTTETPVPDKNSEFRVRVEWYYSSVWKPHPSLQGASAANTSVFCYWCDCATGVDFPRSPDEHDPPGKDPPGKSEEIEKNKGTVLPWMGYTPGHPNELPARNQISYRLLLLVISRLTVSTDTEALFEALSRLLLVDVDKTFVGDSPLYKLSGQQLATIIETFNLTEFLNEESGQDAEGGAENVRDLSWLRDVQDLWRDFHQLMQALQKPADKTPDQFRDDAESWATRFEREIEEQSPRFPAENFIKREYLAPGMRNHIPEAYKIIYNQAVTPEAEPPETEGPPDSEGLLAQKMDNVSLNH